MSNHNRKDELAEHFEFFSRKQIERLPDTFIRQISRAKNMHYFGNLRLRLMRDQNPYNALNLDDEAMEALYEEIQADEFIQNHDWKPTYVRYLMEYNWLGDVMGGTYSPTQVFEFANKRAAALKQIQGIEKSHRIRANLVPSQRWSLDDATHIEHIPTARNIWLDELTAGIRVSVTKELHWMSMLHNHGHSRFELSVFDLPTDISSSWSRRCWSYVPFLRRSQSENNRIDSI